MTQIYILSFSRDLVSLIAVSEILSSWFRILDWYNHICYYRYQGFSYWGLGDHPCSTAYSLWLIFNSSQSPHPHPSLHPSLLVFLSIMLVKTSRNNQHYNNNNNNNTDFRHQYICFYYYFFSNMIFLFGYNKIDKNENLVHLTALSKENKEMWSLLYLSSWLDIF